MSATIDSIPGVAGRATAAVDEQARRAARRIAELHRSLRSYAAPVLFGSTVVATLLAGWMSGLERYITPEYGLGYALGITGGTMMLCLLLYPLRKRFRSLHWMGPIKTWFRAHMVFGILGPSLILFHCNFSLGATNSNVALFSMLIVSTSGIVGRYFYSRIHHGLYGAKVRLGQTRKDVEMARYGINKVFSGATGLLPLLDAFEQEVVKPKNGLPVTTARLLVMPLRVRLLHRTAMRQVEDYLATQPLDGRARQDMRQGAERFLRVYLDAVRRVAETGFYEKMFSMWHVLHLPLFVMLIVTAVFHVIAVHVY